MYIIPIRSYSLLTGLLPGPVQLTLADHQNAEEATTLISIRLQSDEPYKRSVLISQRYALQQARALIDAEIVRLDTLQNATER